MKRLAIGVDDFKEITLLGLAFCGKKMKVSSE